MMRTVGATLAAGYFLLMEMSGRSVLVSAVVPMPGLQVAVYFAAWIRQCHPLRCRGLVPHRILDRLRRRLLGTNQPNKRVARCLFVSVTGKRSRRGSVVAVIDWIDSAHRFLASLFFYHVRY